VTGARLVTTGGASRRLVLLVAMSATFMGGLDSYIVGLALPSVAGAFDAGIEVVQWIPLAYLLAIAGLVVIAGRAADIWGARLVLLAGLATFTAGSAVAAAAPGLWWLVGIRAMQGAGAAMMLAAGQAMVASAYAEGERGRAFGWLHVAVSAGFVAGPLIGGVLIDALTWRAVFLVNVPVGAATVLFARRLPREAPSRMQRLDLAGAATLTLGIVLLLFGLSQGRSAGWGSAAVVGLLAAGAALLAAFALLERRSAQPLLPPRLFRVRAFSVGLLAAFLTFVAMASNMLLVPFLLRDLLGRSASATGLVMITVPLVILWVAPRGGRAAARFSARVPATAGLAAVAAGIAWLATVGPGTATIVVVAALALYGVGAGLFQAPNNSAVLGAAPAGSVGVASGALTTTRQLGQVVGVAVAATLLAARASAYAAGSPPDEASAMAFRDTFLVLAAVAAVAMAVSWLREPLRRPALTRAVRSRA
jgi:EmrB/QacA subfamily drug resistance transporter